MILFNAFVYNSLCHVMKKNSPQSMPGAASTSESIKQAARRLFARHGVDAVTVRDIVRESGTRNASALNYYFGSDLPLIFHPVRTGVWTLFTPIGAG